MSNLIIFSIIFLIVLVIFIKQFRSFTAQLYIRSRIRKGIQQNFKQIKLAKGNKQQLFDIYKSVYNNATSKPNRLFASRDRDKFELKANTELNRMTRNPFTKLYASLLTYSKGFFTCLFLIATILSGGILKEEVKASSLTLPTVDENIQLKLNVNFEDKIDQIVTSFMQGENKLQSFNFQDLANKKVVPVYDVKDLPQAVTNVEQLGQAIAHHMSQFENQFTVYYEGDVSDFETTIDEVFAWLEANEPYLWAVMGEFSTRAKYYGNKVEWHATVNYDLTAEQNAIVLGKIDQIISTIPENATESDKVKFVNDYLVVHTEYNLNSKANPHTPYSVLMNGEGVCEGYALAALLMFEALGIEAKYVVGNAGGPHAWNLVKLDGQWYHLDTTWNDPVPDQGDRVHYQYFLISDEKISDDHEWIKSDYPKTAVNDYL